MMFLILYLLSTHLEFPVEVKTTFWDKLKNVVLFYISEFYGILLIFSVQHWQKLVFETCLMWLLEMKTTRMPNPVQMPFWQQPTSWECCHNSVGPLKTRKYLKPLIARDKKNTKGCTIIKTLKMENLITFLTLIFHHWFYHFIIDHLRNY